MAGSPTPGAPPSGKATFRLFSISYFHANLGESAIELSFQLVVGGSRTTGNVQFSRFSSAQKLQPN